jgi:hypothetical protein
MLSGAALDQGQMLPRDAAAAGKDFAHACELGLPNGCAGLLKVVTESKGSSFESACNHGDGESCFLLGSLYFAGQGVAKDPAEAFALLGKSCALGWSRGCGGLGECYRAGAGTAVDDSRAIQEFDKACRAGVASSCFSASSMYRGLNDSAKAESRLTEGCAISVRFAESNAAYFEGAISSRTGVPAICSSTVR